MASQDLICDIPTEQVKPTPPLPPALSAPGEHPARRKRAPRFGSTTATVPTAAAPPASPFIRERPSERPVSTGRAAALGDLRRRASKQTPSLSPVVTPDPAADAVAPSPVPATAASCTPQRYWTPRRTQTTETGQASTSSIRSAASSAARPDPTLHEIVRKVSTRSPLDGGAPAEPEYVDAFVKCLQLVCDENEPRTDEAYPIEEEQDQDAVSGVDASSTSTSRSDDMDDAIIAKVFPVSIARRYSPDFLRHMQDHMRLSRRSLAAALVYLDRAHKANGPGLTVCNKNVNSLVLSALVIACRVLEQRGYSDEVVALAAGLPGAADVRRSVSFLLDALEWDAGLTAFETQPYEQLLEKLGDVPQQETTPTAMRADTLRARNRTLRMYYPASSLKL